MVVGWAGVVKRREAYLKEAGSALSDNTMELNMLSDRCRALLAGSPDRAARLMIVELANQHWQPEQIVLAVGYAMERFGHGRNIVVTEQMVVDVLNSESVPFKKDDWLPEAC